jgi:hypothetical protein
VLPAQLDAHRPLGVLRERRVDRQHGGQRVMDHGAPDAEERAVRGHVELQDPAGEPGDVAAAHAGFCLADALHPPPPGLEPVYAAKLALGLGTIGWLQRRLTGRPGSS